MGILRRLRRQKMIAEANAGTPEQQVNHKEGMLIKQSINALERNINGTPEEMYAQLASQFFGGCRGGWQNRINKLLKKGKEPTVEGLMADFDNYPRFLEQCERIKLTRDMFQGMAEELIKENQGKIKEVADATV